ncbi:MAG: NAD(+) synthase [Clostridia bacterium]|nr:NAD(+) synthase [Clostridia bacterium]
MSFCANTVMNDCIAWIRDWFAANGPDCNAVVGISGGKDSSITAALCAKALGTDRVIGVLMPNGTQSDIDVARDLVKTLGIRAIEINIQTAYDALCAEIEGKIGEMSHQAIVNLPPRLRMSTLYAVSQTFNGRVANTCNLSEDWVGYSTRYGDSVGDFSPLSNLTVAEVKEMARCAGLPDRFIDKVPSDGLCGKTDEDNLGFTYAVLDRYIRTGECDDEQTKQAIDRRHKANLFKLRLMDTFPYDGPRKAED